MRLIIVCEGETEQEFCKTVLSEYFLGKGIYISYPLVKKTLGGVASWSSLKKQILSHLRENAFVTTMIDYYGIKKSSGFPRMDESANILDAYKRIDFLENAMNTDMPDRYRDYFIPYLQLHEFEALLFSDEDALKAIVPEQELDIRKYEKVMHSFPNPELINNHPETSPSHRMAEIIADYDKVLYGSLIAENIGLHRLMEKCHHFAEWLRQINQKVNTFK